MGGHHLQRPCRIRLCQYRVGSTGPHTAARCIQLVGDDDTDSRGVFWRLDVARNTTLAGLCSDGADSGGDEYGSNEAPRQRPWMIFNNRIDMFVNCFGNRSNTLPESLTAKSAVGSNDFERSAHAGHSRRCHIALLQVNELLMLIHAVENLQSHLHWERCPPM